MHTYFSYIVKPLLRTFGSKNMLLLGGRSDAYCADLLEYCQEYEAQCTVVEKHPTCALFDLAELHRSLCTLLTKKHIDDLTDVQAYDTVIMDGNRLEELKLIEQTIEDACDIPLVLLHGIEEDFSFTSTFDLTLRYIPGFYGTAVLYAKDSLTNKAAFLEEIEKWETQTVWSEHCRKLEDERRELINALKRSKQTVNDAYRIATLEARRQEQLKPPTKHECNTKILLRVKDELAHVYRTKSWRYTAFFRRVLSWFRK